MKKTSIKLMVAAMTLACAMGVPTFAKDGTTVTILHTNDIHGNVKDDGKSTIGFAKLSTFVKESKEKGNVLALDAGDMFQGTPFVNLEKGKNIVALANEIGYDAMTTGNHEFDFGSKNLFEIIKSLNYPVISANLFEGKDQALKSYIVKEFDGVKVGVFGMATPETAFKTHPANIVGYSFEDIVKTAEKTVKTLKETEKVDVVVMLGHLGVDEGDYTSDVVAKAVKGIDVIVDGHSHTTLPEGRKVEDTLIVSTGTALKNVGKVELTIEDGKVESKKATLLDYAAFKDVKPNEKIVEAIKQIDEKQGAILNKVIGKTEIKLNGERAEARTGETNLGQLATDAILELTGAQMAITNGGGIRASIEAGDITMNQVVTVFPFGNTIMVKDIKGSDIVAALEHGVSEYPNQKGAFPHVAGVTFTLNAYKEPGSRVSDVKIAGQALEMDKLYTVATNDFMAAGGDDYTMFKAYPIKAEFNTLMDALLNHIQKLGTVKDTYKARITVVKEAPAGEKVVAKVIALRPYLEEKAFEVKYDNKKEQITAVKGDAQITFTVGKTDYSTKNKEAQKTGQLSKALEVKKGTTYIDQADLDKALQNIAKAA